LRIAPKAVIAIFTGFAIFFVFALTELFQIRFRAGDIYPPYSSLRTDPVGTNAYFDALDDIRGLSVSRNFKNTPRLEGNISLFLLGTDKDSIKYMDRDEVALLETFVSKGGRLVITFFPGRPEKALKKTDLKEKKKCGEKDCRVSLTERWGFKFGAGDKENVAASRREAALSSERYRLPKKISWHSGISFDQLAKEWEVIYRSGDKPVVMEKQYGKGTIVFASDSYFTSNEAILKERYPELLAWLVGPYGNIMFDETHLGVYENPSIASLFRKYRLHGMFGGFLLLAILFVWKNSRGLTPRLKTEEDNNISAGKDNLSGFISLLRRNIPKRSVLAVSVQEWKKSLRRGSLSPEKAERIDSIAAKFSDKKAKKEEQVNAYRLINKILSEKMAHGKQN
jgi:hypothetical protein